MLSFIKEHVPDANTAQLAGNSVHVDRMFLVKHMPNFVAHLNYRIVDVSSVKELARRWFPYVSAFLRGLLVGRGGGITRMFYCVPYLASSRQMCLL